MARRPRPPSWMERGTITNPSGFRGVCDCAGAPSMSATRGHAQQLLRRNPSASLSGPPLLGALCDWLLVAPFAPLSLPHYSSSWLSAESAATNLSSRHESLE